MITWKLIAIFVTLLANLGIKFFTARITNTEAFKCLRKEIQSWRGRSRRTQNCSILAKMVAKNYKWTEDRSYASSFEVKISFSFFKLFRLFFVWTWFESWDRSASVSIWKKLSVIVINDQLEDAIAKKYI